MVVIALFLPLVVLLMLFGLDAFENRLFPTPPSSPPDVTPTEVTTNAP